MEGVFLLPNLSTKELSAISDQLNTEQTLIKKYKLYASQSTDVQIKNKCQEIAAKHQNHYERLLTFLN